MIVIFFVISKIVKINIINNADSIKVVECKLSKEKSENESNSEYYVKNKGKILAQCKSLIKETEVTIFSAYDKEVSENVKNQFYTEVENLLPRLPYVGGDDSPFTLLMIQSAITVAFYKASKPLNLSERESGELIYRIAEKHGQSMSLLKKWMYRKMIFSKKVKSYWEKWMNESQKRTYPQNWVGTFIQGDNKAFDYGYDFTECGCLKLMEKENTKEITPYVCLCDYARMRALGIGFKRTKTLAKDAEMCDFRFIKGYKTPRGWPPEYLEELGLL